MHCPQCGQQQVSGVIRFCSRCGFPLEGVIHLLANGGALPVYQSAEEPKEMSPRKKGVRQGGVLFLAGAVLVPVLGVLNANLNFDITMLVALAAIICFVGGLMRLLFAAIFEEGAPQPRPVYGPPIMPSQLSAPTRAALPPPSVNTSPGWRSRPNTAEMFQPPSVTENTTRLLDKETDRGSDQ